MAESATSAKGDWSKSIGAIVFLVLGLLMFIGFIALFGAVRGHEFAPSDFSRRSFVFYRIPLAKLQITPVVHKTTTNALESYIGMNFFDARVDAEEVEPVGESQDESDNKARKKRPQKRWDIVEVTPLTRASEKGAASCLCSYLDSADGPGSLTWLDWSKKNPKLAKALWQMVRQSAINRLYFAVPEMMELAKSSDGMHVDEFESALEEIVASAAALREQAAQP